MPKQEKYEDITVMDVQFVQSKLQIITQNDVISNNEKIRMKSISIPLI
ncbi:hypothetical protein [Peribacillus simplex]